MHGVQAPEALAGPLVQVTAIGLVRGKSLDVHAAGVESRRALHDPAGHLAPDTRRVDDALRIHAGRHEETSDLGCLADDEGRVGREALRSVDETVVACRCQRWHCAFGSGPDVPDVLPVGVEGRVPVRGDIRCRTRDPAGLERPEKKPVGLRPDVEAVVDVAQHGEAGDVDAERMRTHMHMLGGIQGHGDTHRGSEVARPQAAGEDDRARGDGTARGADAHGPTSLVVN